MKMGGGKMSHQAWLERKDRQKREEIARDAAIGTVESIPRPRRKDPQLVSEAVRRAVRAALGQAWGKKPICTVLTTVL